MMPRKWLPGEFSPVRPEIPIFKAGYSYLTTETNPRRVGILGPSLADPDCYVCKFEGDDKPHWLMNCGNKKYDGSIIGGFGDRTTVWLDPDSAEPLTNQQ